MELVREGAQKSEGFAHLLSRFPHVWSGDVENLRPFELSALTKKSVKSVRWSKQQTHEMCMEMHYRKSGPFSGGPDTFIFWWPSCFWWPLSFSYF